MSPAVSLQIWAHRAAWILLVVSLLVTAHLAWQARQFSGASSPPASGVGQAALAPWAWPPPVDLSGVDWSMLRGRIETSTAANSPLAKRFRLAGTFFEFTSTGSDTRKAIIDDLQRGAQVLVSEKDHMDDVLVVQILRDRVRLRDGNGEEAELFLSFSRPEGGVAAADGAGAVAGGGRFGMAKVAENRWIFDREALLRYYEELRDQPERLVLLFDSLKPVYTAQGWIEGYRLGVEGERDFFEATGLAEGDIVRRVNNVDMTNRRRAEFFLKQFVQNDASAFMLDIERGGSTNRLVYEVR